MDVVKVGLIGAGRIGKLHAENIIKHIPSLKLVAIADQTQDSEWFKAFNGVQWFEDAEELLAREEIQAVLICSPTDTHIPLILHAAQLKKHIFCEKPLSMQAQDIPSALDAVQQAGINLQIGFNRRFDKNFQAIKEAIVSGKIGRPYSLHLTSRDPSLPPLDYLQRSGGIFMDMSIHDFDMAQYIMGSPIEEIYVNASARIDPSLAQIPDQDVAIINLAFKNGALGVINNSRQACYGYDQRLEVLGSEGMIEADHELEDVTVQSFSSHIQTAKPKYFFLQRYQQSFIQELQAFAFAIIEKSKSPVSGWAGYQAVLAAKACERSLSLSRSVRLQEIA